MDPSVLGWIKEELLAAIKANATQLQQCDAVLDGLSSLAVAVSMSKMEVTTLKKNSQDAATCLANALILVDVDTPSIDSGENADDGSFDADVREDDINNHIDAKQAEAAAARNSTDKPSQYPTHVRPTSSTGSSPGPY